MFTIDISKQAKPGHRTIRGRACKSNTTTHYFKLADLQEAVKFSLECSFFENMGEIYFQVRGSSIGSQCSPPICAIVVAFVEFLWLRSYRLKIISDILFIRYVDNRLICLPRHIAILPEYKELLSLDFYGRPVELEECGNTDILGFKLNLLHLSCRYNFPTEDYQFPSPANAGSASRLISGFQSRVHLIIRRTWPRQYITQDLRELIQLYTTHGFSRLKLQVVVSRILRNQRRQ